MKQKLFFLALFIPLFSSTVFAQEISVKSFQALPNDLTPRMNPVTNDNGQACALLKIITTETGFTFETDALGMCKDVEYKTAEIWLWLAPGSRVLTIKHPQLGQLRNYEYPVAIEKSCTYEMVLLTGRVKTIVEELPTTNWVAITVEPQEALLKIDGEIVSAVNGQVSKMLSVGEHTLEGTCPMYHPYYQKFEIKATEKTQFVARMKPNFGYLNITTTPESGATVYIDGERKGTTPFKSDKMESKTYTVQVVKEMFKESRQQVTVKDNLVEEVKIAMQPNFAEPAIVCPDGESEIWVNGEKKAVGSWSGRLPAGAYQFEARKPSHKTSVSTLTLQNGDNRTINLPAPSPIYGVLNVNSTPFDADILLDGKKVGTTPERLDKVLVGTHEFALQKQGYVSVTKQLAVKEGETIEINETLLVDEKIRSGSGSTGGNSQTPKPQLVQSGSGSTGGNVQPSETISGTLKPSFFATLNAAYSPAPQWSYGFSMGRVKHWGWYVTAMSNFDFRGMENPMNDGVFYNYTGIHATTRISAVAGVVLRTCKPLSLRMGAGCGYRAQNFQMADGNWYAFPGRTFAGLDMNAGLMWHIRSFLLTADVTTTGFRYVEVNLGLGFCLKR